MVSRVREARPVSSAARRWRDFEHLNATHPGEVYKNEVGTGVLLEYGSHLVDMMRALWRTASRLARTHRLNPRPRREPGARRIRVPGATAVVEAGWKIGHHAGCVLVAGDAGEAFYEGTLTRGGRAHSALRAAPTSCSTNPHPFNDYVESFYLLERECVDAMLGNGAYHRPVAQHLRTLAATFAAYESAATGRVVEIRRRCNEAPGRNGRGGAVAVRSRLHLRHRRQHERARGDRIWVTPTNSSFASLSAGASPKWTWRATCRREKPSKEAHFHLAAYRARPGRRRGGAPALGARHGGLLPADLNRRTRYRC